MHTTSTHSNKVNDDLVHFTEKKQERLKAKIYAPLEPRTVKIRERLQRRLHAIDQQITQEKLSSALIRIKERISRQMPHREKLDKENFHLFTQGQNAAEMSSQLRAFRDKLKEIFYNSISSTTDIKE